ncbi:MAG: hypothetical protein ACR2N0_15145 [Rubrobacteraceae bacterium]
MRVPNNDGSTVIAHEPGWWFSGIVAGIVALLAGMVVCLVRRKGHPGWIFGLCALVALPLALSLALVASRKSRIP